MVDLASTQAQAKEVAPPASREGGQAEAAVAGPEAIQLRSLSTRWTRCTANWRIFTPSLPSN
jgi:hypothetical protein